MLQVRELMNKLLKIFLYLWLIGACIGFIFHFFIPNIASDLSLWNSSKGWQREIALWNMGIILAIIYSFMKNDDLIFRFMIVSLTSLSFILGTNHIMVLLIHKEIALLHLTGGIANYAMGFYGLYIIGEKNAKK